MRPSSRALDYGFVPVGVALLLSLAWFLTLRSYDTVEDDVRSITTNSAPSLLHLAELGMALDVVEREAELAFDRGAWPTGAGGRLRTASALDTMRYHLAEYARLPSYPAEVSVKLQLKALFDELTALVPEPEDVADDAAVSRAALPLVQVIRRTLRDLTRMNATRAAAEATSVEDALASESRRSFAVVVGMVAVATCSWLLLRRQRARLDRERERRIAELDAFAARVAHDLRGPIGSIALALELLGRDAAGLTPGARAVVERIASGVRQQTQLIDALLAFARAGAAADPDLTSRADEVVQSVLSGLAGLVQEHRTQLRWVVEPDLVVDVPPGVLASIADNLARNAILHMGASEVRRIDLRVTSTPGSVVLEVEDTGPGMQADQLERLFRPFQRGSTSGPGHGLGLATVKRLVEGHRGTITVTSQPGRGSTFRVELPRAVAASGRAGRRPARDLQVAGGSSRS